MGDLDAAEPENLHDGPVKSNLFLYSTCCMYMCIGRLWVQL